MPRQETFDGCSIPLQQQQASQLGVDDMSVLPSVDFALGPKFWQVFIMRVRTTGHCKSNNTHRGLLWQQQQQQQQQQQEIQPRYCIYDKTGRRFFAMASSPKSATVDGNIAQSSSSSPKLGRAMDRIPYGIVYMKKDDCQVLIGGSRDQRRQISSSSSYFDGRIQGTGNVQYLIGEIQIWELLISNCCCCFPSLSSEQQDGRT
jgi:hypothetical protein